MKLHALFFDSALQDAILEDLKRDIETYKHTPPGLMGCRVKPMPPGHPPSSINGFFAGSEPTPDVAARKLCDTCDLSCVETGPHWGRIWLMLILLMVSPRLTQSILSEPGNLGALQQTYIHGKSTGFRVEPFRQRMHTMMCGDTGDGNAMTPFEIVVRELYQLRQTVTAPLA